jgi:hypothetical protein
VHVHNPRPVQVTSSSRASSSIHVKDYAQPVVAAPSAFASNRVKSEVRKALSFSSAPPEIIHPVQYPPPSRKDRKHTMSLTSQNSYANGQTPKDGPGSYSPDPNSIFREAREDRREATPCSPTIRTAQRQGMIVEGAKEPPSLKGVGDLSNTVDTDVTTKTLPGTYQSALPHASIIRSQSNTSRPLSNNSHWSRCTNTKPCLLPSPLSEIKDAPTFFDPDHWPLASPHPQKSPRATPLSNSITNLGQ